MKQPKVHMNHDRGVAIVERSGSVWDYFDRNSKHHRVTNFHGSNMLKAWMRTKDWVQVVTA